MKVLESRPFSLVILDVLLPDGDGIDLLRQIRNNPQLSRVPVIFLSTEAEVKDRILGLTFGADEYIGKPYDVGYLVQRAREFMSRYGSIPAPAPDSGRPGKILAVDDSPTYLDALARVLREDGHDIILARSGEEALELLMYQSVECVIMDLLMPGMGGMEAARRIRSDASLKTIPIMILTGRDEPRDRHVGAQIGVDEFVIKSPELSMLKVQLRGLLRRVRRTKRAREKEDSIPPPSSMSLISNQVIAGSLLDKVITASGLSTVIGPSTIARACLRAGVDAKSMSEIDLRRALPEIEEILRVFFSGEERRRRLAAITALAQGTDSSASPSAVS